MSNASNSTIEEQIKQQGDYIRELKAKKSEKSKVWSQFPNSEVRM